MRLTPWRLAGLAVLSGSLQILAFPLAGPTPLWRAALAWVALLPLLFALIERAPGGRPLSLLHSTGLGYLCGVVWYLGNCSWIYQTMYHYGGLPEPVAFGILLLFALYLGLYHALFAFLIAQVRRSRGGRNAALLVAPFVWVAVELARARITGFPWDLLGNSQIDNSLLTKLAPVTGVYGLSFVVAAINALWLVRIQVKERRYTRQLLTGAGVVLVVAYVVSLRQMQAPLGEPTTASATLVQENLSVGATAADQPEESIAQLMRSFTTLSLHPTSRFYAGMPETAGTPLVTLERRDAQAAVASDLIVWPEAPSGFRSDDPDFSRRMQAMADSTHALAIIGSIGLVRNANPEQQRPYFAYDSAAVFTPGADASRAARYDKVHLVPWGEYIPFKRFFSFARKLTAGVGDMDPGTDRTVFRHAGHAYGVFICYESIFGDEVRQFTKNGAEILVNISDDGWYGDTGAPWQHLNMVRMRALENHRWILRSTNTGVTSAINPQGRVVLAAERHVRTSLHVPFGYESEITFYTAHGDLFAYFCALVTVVSLGMCWVRRGLVTRAGA